MLLVSLGVLAFPRACVTFFARRFDAARLETATAMLRLLVPWAVGVIMLSLLSVWNVYRGRYSLNITLMCLGHATLIPLIFFSLTRFTICLTRSILTTPYGISSMTMV